MFTPPNYMPSVLDKHGGFTAIMASGDSLWRPGALAKHGTDGRLVEGSVKHDDFYQRHEPVVSALYRIPRYSYPVKIWWLPDGTRLA